MKKPAPRNSFQSALKEAEKRVTQAMKERVHAEKTLAALNGEIPALERTIAALRHQIDPLKHPAAPTFEPSTYSISYLNSKTGEVTPVTPIPAHLAKFVGPQDMTGFGSVPMKPAAVPTTEITSEEESLPPIEGKKVLE